MATDLADQLSVEEFLAWPSDKRSQLTVRNPDDYGPYYSASGAEISFAADTNDKDPLYVTAYQCSRRRASSLWYPNGSLITQGDNQTVYLIENGQKRGFESKEAFEKMNLDWCRIIEVPPEALAAYPDGPSLRVPQSGRHELVKDQASNDIHFITDLGFRRKVLNPKVLSALFGHDAHKSVSRVDIDHYPVDPAVPVLRSPFWDGTLVSAKGAPDDVYVISDSAKRLVSDGAFERLGYRVRDVITVDDTIVEMIPSGPAIDSDTVQGSTRRAHSPPAGSSAQGALENFGQKILNRQVMAVTTIPAGTEGLQVDVRAKTREGVTYVDAFVREQELIQVIAQHGIAVRSGELATITGVRVEDRHMEIHLNGGGNDERLSTAPLLHGPRLWVGNRVVPGGGRINIRFTQVEDQILRNVSVYGLRSLLWSIFEMDSTQFDRRQSAALKKGSAQLAEVDRYLSSVVSKSPGPRPATDEANYNGTGEAAPGRVLNRALFGKWRSKTKSACVVEFKPDGECVVNPFDFAGSAGSLRRGTFRFVSPDRLHIRLDKNVWNDPLPTRRIYDQQIGFRILEDVLRLFDTATGGTANEELDGEFVKEESYDQTSEIPEMFEVQDKGSVIPRVDALRLKMAKGDVLVGYRSLTVASGADEVLYRYGRPAVSADRNAVFGLRFKEFRYYSEDEFGSRVWLVLRFLNASRDREDPSPPWSHFRLVSREFVPIRE
ncbi:MAG: hypothetical protein Kow001_03680 [Acidobacteriota bacterium]